MWGKNEDGSLIEKEWRGGRGLYAMMVTGELRGPATKWMVCFQWAGSDSSPC
jgi:hypothetical protein